MQCYTAPSLTAIVALRRKSPINQSNTKSTLFPRRAHRYDGAPCVARGTKVTSRGQTSYPSLRTSAHSTQTKKLLSEAVKWARPFPQKERLHIRKNEGGLPPKLLEIFIRREHRNISLYSKNGLRKMNPLSFRYCAEFDTKYGQILLSSPWYFVRMFDSASVLCCLGYNDYDDVDEEGASLYHDAPMSGARTTF